MIFYQQKTPPHPEPSFLCPIIFRLLQAFYMAEHQEIITMKEAQVPSLEP